MKTLFFPFLNLQSGFLNFIWGKLKKKKKKHSRPQQLSVYSWRLQCYDLAEEFCSETLSGRTWVHTWLQSQPSLTHCGGRCSRVIQVKVNASEGQMYVFISIILHNNTGFLGGREAQKRENRCNKRSPSGMRPYLGERKMFIYKPGLKTCDGVAAASSFDSHFGKMSLNLIPHTVNRGH